MVLGEFPWHAAVYEKPRNYTLICGATIISEYALISGLLNSPKSRKLVIFLRHLKINRFLAAHCFYDRNNNIQRNAKDYEIGVSKITRERNKLDSETTQFYEVGEA